MAGLISIRAQGLNQLTRQLIALGVDVEDLKDAFSELSHKGEEIASRAAPVGGGSDPHPGQLRDDVRGNRARNKAVVTVGRVRVPYAGAINFGWADRNIKGSGFMQEVDKVLAPWAPTLLEQSIGELIRKKGLG